MSGGIVLGDPDDEASIAMGNMNMVADFTNSEISGAATELKNYVLSGECLTIETCDMDAAAEWNGELVLDGVIEGSGFTGTLDGELTASEVTEGVTATAVADVNLDVEGGFGVDDAGLMAGAFLMGGASVDYSVDGELEATVVDTLVGGFYVAE